MKRNDPLVAEEITAAVADVSSVLDAAASALARLLVADYVARHERCNATDCEPDEPTLESANDHI